MISLLSHFLCLVDFIFSVFNVFHSIIFFSSFSCENFFYSILMIYATFIAQTYAFQLDCYWFIVTYMAEIIGTGECNNAIKNHLGIFFVRQNAFQCRFLIHWRSILDRFFGSQSFTTHIHISTMVARATDTTLPLYNFSGQFNRFIHDMFLFGSSFLFIQF